MGIAKAKTEANEPVGTKSMNTEARLKPNRNKKQFRWKSTIGQANQEEPHETGVYEDEAPSSDTTQVKRERKTIMEYRT